jgi:oligopeptide/dipeptide ABC transporter ATP-binding protein
LSCSPRLLLADEPTTALDVTVQAQILDLLARQQKERNMAMILVSHDLDVVAGRTDEIAVMYAGRIVERAATRALFANPKMPYTEALLASTPRHGDTPHARLQAIPGRPPSPLQLPTGCAFAPRCTYVTDRCRDERPPLVTMDGHSYACWNPLGLSARTGSRGGQRGGPAGADTAGGNPEAVSESAPPL